MKKTLTPLLFLALVPSCTMNEETKSKAGKSKVAAYCPPPEVQARDEIVLEEQPTDPVENPTEMPEAIFTPSSGELLDDPGSSLPRGHKLHFDHRFQPK